MQRTVCATGDAPCVRQRAMVILRKQNYLFDDLLDALSLYSEGRSDWEEVTQLLDRAADVVRDRRRELTGK